MKVLKFGGGIIRNADAITRMAEVIRRHGDDDLVVVVSALNKMTNAFEKLVNAYLNEPGETTAQLETIRKYHRDLASELFSPPGHEAFRELERLLTELLNYLSTPSANSFDFEYDQIVCYGELLSSSIISYALKDRGVGHKLVDARDLIKTNNHYRAALVETALTGEAVHSIIGSYLREDTEHKKILLTQGFIGSTHNNHTTTLGREGSDFSAAILAYVLDASAVVIWKDVPGIMNADPVIFDDAVKIERLSYSEAMKMAYYGAKVVHPKTLRPLEQKNIPLYVKPFDASMGKGTVVHGDTPGSKQVTTFMVKRRQALISLQSTEFSFITSEDMSHIFHLLHRYSLSVNLMQDTAQHFSFCIDHLPGRTGKLVSDLENLFRVNCTTDVEVITIQNYTEKEIEKAVGLKEVIVEQRNPGTVRMVVTE